ncbi:hypothetical protein CD30_14675 [Ureibacillus massiliensis 4400831 = CIP 108448 = CCUG 49529]|uniref:HTH lysR-type domain-containing protein n=1 Tax=Ureibacillus massiliensis 4400831 = CIP 108448 = CCUG 49529 TaxID=1211035 RepID=A0A0A3J2H5_9BACL|nr:LysR substrate-binding domain-containing protein [Ureibacillus massiliensis]KGR89905.1 hypothetical protein CD30_14675 [Ureibacillus massiliensis 4400831 = CIP 108448 = CCUG 49529]
MKIHQLRYFITVAEELHYSRAAEKLNISQPPLSQQIKQLEDDLGVVLFKRNKRNVQLTEAGKSFYENSKLIIHYIEHAKKEALRIQEGEIGGITLGFGGSAAFDILPEIIKACNLSIPDVKIDLKQLTTSEQLRALEEKKIDVGILVTPIKTPGIETKFFRKEELVLCLNTDHPLAKTDEPIDPKDLKSENFILPPRNEGDGYYKSIFQVYNDGGFFPNIIQTAKEQHTMVSLVAAKIGVVIVPQSTTFIKLSNITYKSFNKKFYKVSSLAWKKDNMNPVINSFLKVMEQSVLPKFN